MNRILTFFILSILLLGGQANAQTFQDYIEKGDSCNKIRLFNQAINFYEKALNLKPERIITQKNEVQIFEKLGSAYSNTAEYETALEYYFKYIEKDVVKNNKTLLSETYNSIGVNYKYLDQNDQALKYYKKSIENARQTDSLRIGTAYNNMANIYKDKGDLKTTKDYYKKALTYFENNNYYRGIVVTVMNIGVSEMDDNKMATALDYLNRAEKLAKEHHDTTNYIIISVNLGDYYTKIGEYDKAESHLNWALENSIKQNSRMLVSESYKSLVKLYKTKEDYKSAFKYLELFKANSDSVYMHNTNRKYAELEAKYSIREKEKENDILLQEQQFSKSRVESQRKYIWALLVLVGLSILFLILFYFQRKKTSKSKKILEEQNKEITKAKIQLEDLNHQYEKLIDKYEGGETKRQPNTELS